MPVCLRNPAQSLPGFKRASCGFRGHYLASNGLVLVSMPVLESNFIGADWIGESLASYFGQVEAQLCSTRHL